MFQSRCVNHTHLQELSLFLSPERKSRRKGRTPFYPPWRMERRIKDEVVASSTACGYTHTGHLVDGSIRFSVRQPAVKWPTSAQKKCQPIHPADNHHESCSSSSTVRYQLLAHWSSVNRDQCRMKPEYGPHMFSPASAK